MESNSSGLPTATEHFIPSKTDSVALLLFLLLLQCVFISLFLHLNFLWNFMRPRTECMWRSISKFVGCLCVLSLECVYNFRSTAYWLHFINESNKIRKHHHLHCCVLLLIIASNQMTCPLRLYSHETNHFIYICNVRWLLRVATLYLLLFKGELEFHRDRRNIWFCVDE